MTYGVEPLLGWLRSALLAGFGVAGGPIGRLVASPYPAEEALVARAVAKRRLEFRAGRSYARDALLQIGCAPMALGRDAAGAAVWPPGHVGSISHSDGLAVAVAAPSSLCAGVGLDLTSVAPLDPDLKSFICRPEELSYAGAASRKGPDPAKRIFAAKESSIKSLYAARGLVFDFLDLEIAFSADGAEFQVTGADRDSARRLPDLHRIQGRMRQADEMLLAVTYIYAGREG